MQLHAGGLRASPTDLANFLACRHKTTLDLRVAEGTLEKPGFVDPLAAILRERGDAHEQRYVDSLRAQGLDVVKISDGPLDERRAATLAAMRAGADVIVQAALGNDRWSGYADVLRKVSVPSPTLGAWSYEAHDTKLARETRGGTILQLCVYSELIGEIQGHAPEHFHVVTPAATHEFRFDDFAAFYRQVKARLWQFVETVRAAGEQTTTYPDPVEHCSVCRWSARCTSQRRQDDHLCFVAGLGRLHAIELAGQGVTTLAALAALPVPLEFSPHRGAKETYQRLREQARLQLERRTTGRLVWEALPIDPTCGLSQLPASGPGDLFLDLEGDPFGRPGGGVEPGEGGREYLFGLGRVDAGGSCHYSARWAFTDGEERAVFDEVMTDIMTALDADPSMHVYHYAAYEASAFKRLAGRYAAREADVDRLLRGGRFVDLYAIVRRALRAGVERYSIKDLEPFYGFVREVALDEAGDQRRLVEVALEVGDASAVTPAIAATVEGYNKDDCRSTLELRRWLESLRDQQIAAGADIARPPLEPGDPSDKVKERDRRAMELRSQLLAAVPGDPAQRTPEERARHLLASLVDWHRCEERFAWGEFHRLREKPLDDLLDEPGALVGLSHVGRVPPAAGSRRRAVVDCYTYPVQENDVREGDQLRLPDDTDLGTVEAIDKAARTIDIKKRVEQTDTHPTTVIALSIVHAPEQEKSIQRVAESVIALGLDDIRGDRVVNDLLLARAPRLASGPFLREGPESATDFAVRAGADLDDSVLAIQGPPGAGKTFTGAKMIAHLVAAGRKVGVVANSHKVIRKLLVDAGKAAAGPLPIAHKPGDDQLPAAAGVEVEEVTDNAVARAWLDRAGGGVLGGTAWMWARAEFVKAADVLFVDEAGQMSLANVLAVAPAARSLVLLGDPQQLDQPQRGHHPDGAEISALDHILGGHQTMPEGRGIFLPITYRLAPEVAAFTSEVFYERKLMSKPGLERQRLIRAGRFEGAGLFVVDVEHDGCRNASLEEAQVVRAVVSELLESGAGWTDEAGQERLLTPADVLVVAPYNAHVNLLQEHVDLPMDRIGTVDKFQGQEAPVVIYSMATSRPEDAPRGMEFLYSLNRLNVATSRARCACLLVASPRLFEPECRTPRQMQLANALARYREMAR